MQRLRFLICHRVTALATALDAVFAAAGIGVVKILPRAVRASAYAERWVRAVCGLAQVRLTDE